MALIILEGPDGCGKTSTIMEMQKLLPLSHLLKLSGSPKDVDTPDYMRILYGKIAPFLIYTSQQQHVLCDRFTLSERVYSQLFKSYQPTYLDAYEEELKQRVTVYQVYLDVCDSLLQSRLQKKVQESPNEKHPDTATIQKVARVYKETISDKTCLPTVNVSIDKPWPPTEVANYILNQLGVTPKMETAYTESR